MKPWQRSEPTETTKVGFRTVVTKQFKTNSGTIVRADTTNEEGATAVSVVALTTDDKVIVARQFRCGPEMIFDELPGGGVEKGENPEDAIRRELHEETGYEATRIEYLGKNYRDGWNNAVWHGYIAYGCESSDEPRHLDDFEEIEVDLISIEQLLANAKNAKMSDASTVFMALDKLTEIRRTHETTN